MATDSASSLTPEQSYALFDILTHRETYAEIENFKYPGAIQKYGPPFQDDISSSQSPTLQSLLSKFVLKLPGLRDVSPEFWKTRIADLIEELSQAELSESYDKGVLGIRKTLATAISALIEYPARGSLGGVPKDDKLDSKREWDPKNPDDVVQSWRVALQAMVYGDLIDELFQKAAETDDLSKHGSLVQSMHEFVIVNLASLMHYALVLSPEGPTLLRMIESVHKMLPYMIIRQTLRIGNVATMISGMMRVMLAKASVSSVTNWVGLTSGADEGMNLLQQIISQVLGWDKRELKKRAEKIEKDKDAPPKEVREELKDWIKRSREEHEECRARSKEQDMSIVAIIMAMSSHSPDMSDAQHAKALEYLALQLGIRDRQEIVRVLCHRNPDHLTAAIKDGVDAYTPMIRNVHQAVNLSDTVGDFERFLTDMLKMSKPSGPKGQEKPPNVEDFVELLHRHQNCSHKFLHQVAKNGKEITAWFHEYAHMAAAQFKQDKPPPSEAVVSDKMAAGGMQKAVEEAFARLSEDDQKAVKAELEAYEKYLHDLHAASAARISAVIKRTHSAPYGPGAYLARWQHLMDTTLITPASPHGHVRRGASKSVKEEARKDVDGDEAGFVTEEQAEKAIDEKTPDVPDVDKTVSLLGPEFRRLLAAGGV